MNLKILIAPVVGLAIMGGMMIVSNNKLQAATNELDEQMNILYDLQNELEIKQATDDDIEKKFIRDTTGLDTQRVSNDEDIAHALMSKIFTWSSHEEYENARKTMNEDYDVPVDGYVLTELFPEDASTEDVDGTVYYAIDAFNRNSTFENMKLYVTNISGTDYSYYAFIKFSSSDQNGNEATGDVIMTFDTDADGNINNLHGYTIN